MMTWISKAEAGERCAREDCEAGMGVGDAVVRSKVTAGVVVFHPGCWLHLAESLAAAVPGRRRLELGVRDRVTRLSLLRRYAAVNQRIREYKERLAREPGDGARIRLMILRQELTRAQYRAQIEAVGGVPRSWRGEEAS